MRRLLLVLLLVSAAVPLFATEPNPSAKQRELVGHLMEVTGLEKQSTAMMDAMLAQFEQEFLGNVGNDPDDVEEAKEMWALIRERAAKIDYSGSIREAMVRIYAKYFTEPELADLVAFYDTPTGRKSIEVMPDLMREGMQMGAEHLAPKIDAMMTEVHEVMAKRRPWRRTMSDIRNVAGAIEAYALDHDRYPSGDYASLKEQLVPTNIKAIPEKDIWGNAYAYSVSSDGATYRLVSAGADGNFEWDSRRIAAKKADAEAAEDAEPQTRYSERLEDDVIYENGHFLQLPVQARPKGE